MRLVAGGGADPPDSDTHLDLSGPVPQNCHGFLRLPDREGGNARLHKRDKDQPLSEEPDLESGPTWTRPEPDAP